MTEVKYTTKMAAPRVTARGKRSRLFWFVKSCLFARQFQQMASCLHKYYSAILSLFLMESFFPDAEILDESM